MRKQIRIFKKITENFTPLENEVSGERVHKLRVCTRRLRAIFWVLRHDFSAYRLIKFESIIRDLKAVGRVLGTRRQLDVDLEISEKFKIDADFLCRKRRNAGDKMTKFVFSRAPTIALQMDKIVNSLNARTLKWNVPGLADHLKKRLRRWQKHPPVTDGDFHELRIFVKKTRYILEARGQQPRKIMSRFQTLLGKAHDLEIFARTIENTPKIERERKKYRHRCRNKQKKALRVLKEELKGK